MDPILVEQARHGDREAFTVLVHQVSDSLFAVAQRILRDPGLAEDALQNALVLAWRRLPKLRDPDRFEAWIHRILVHACYDEVPSGQALAGPGPERCRWPARRARTAAGRLADRDELERAFRRLTVEQRAVFVMHHYLGLPLVEVAELLGIPAGTARSRLHYALAGLRDALLASAPRTSGSPRKDDPHDRRPLARTRRSVVHRGRTDPGPGGGGRRRPAPHPDDTPGTGLAPVEAPSHDHPTSTRARSSARPCWRSPASACWRAADRASSRCPPLHRHRRPGRAWARPRPRPCRNACGATGRPRPRRPSPASPLPANGSSYRLDWQDGESAWIQSVRGTTLLHSSSAEAPTGEIRLVWAQVTGCPDGTEGRYAWERPGDGEFLTLTLIEDACASRAEAFARTWVHSLSAVTDGGPGVIPWTDRWIRATLPAMRFGLGGANDVADFQTFDAGDPTTRFLVFQDPMGDDDPCATGGGRPLPVPSTGALIEYLGTLPGATVEQRGWGHRRAPGHAPDGRDLRRRLSIRRRRGPPSQERVRRGHLVLRPGHDPLAVGRRRRWRHVPVLVRGRGRDARGRAGGHRQPALRRRPPDALTDTGARA